MKKIKISLIKLSFNFFSKEKTLTKRGIVLAMVIATVFLIATVGSASAEHACVADDGSGDAYFCSDTVLKSCTLNGSMTCADTTKPGLNVGASDITINGSGYKITGSETRAVCGNAVWGTTSQVNPAIHSGIVNNGEFGVSEGYGNVVIENLEIKNFCSGITLGCAMFADYVDCNTVRNCKIHDNGNGTAGPGEVITHGIHMVAASNCLITKNTIYNNKGTGDGCGSGGNGVFMHGDLDERGDWNTITCNKFYDNKKSGFFMKYKCMHCILSNNYATGNGEGGIVPMCSKSDYNTIEYNDMSGNGKWGFMSAGNYNTIRYNTANNNAIGIFLGSAGLGPGDWNNVTNNTACGNTDIDIKSNDVANNFAENNTCNSITTELSPTGDGKCSWSCGTPVSVYFDFDGDTYYSKDPADCTCNNILDAGSCCNPGLFNGSEEAKASYEASCNCQWTVGNDPNDCDASVKPPTYTISGYTDPAADKVNITNLNNSKKWPADYVGLDGFYNLTLTPGEDVNATETLRIIAKKMTDGGSTYHPENATYIVNVTDHEVTSDEIDAGGVSNVNLALNEFCIHYDYPYETQELGNYSGAAVMKMWTNFKDVTAYSQDDLQTMGRANNSNLSRPDYVDPRGMARTLRGIIPLPPYHIPSRFLDMPTQQKVLIGQSTPSAGGSGRVQAHFRHTGTMRTGWQSVEYIRARSLTRVPTGLLSDTTSMGSG
jgi:parallel beta-helix repeat protein